MHHHVWCSKPSANCWSSSGKLWLRHLPLLSKLLELRFQLRTPTDKLCQVFQGHLKGLGSPNCSAVPFCSYTSVAKPFGVPFNLLVDAACSYQMQDCCSSVPPGTSSDLWEKENATISSRVHLEEITVLQLRALTVFALHSRSTRENETGNN